MSILLNERKMQIHRYISAQKKPTSISERTAS